MYTQLTFSTLYSVILYIISVLGVAMILTAFLFITLYAAFVYLEAEFAVVYPFVFCCLKYTQLQIYPNTTVKLTASYNTLDEQTHDF